MNVKWGVQGQPIAGVHAAGQVARLPTRKILKPHERHPGLNDLLPHDSRILLLDRAADRFHARHDSTSRVYLYNISRRRSAFRESFPLGASANDWTPGRWVESARPSPSGCTTFRNFHLTGANSTEIEPELMGPGFSHLRLKEG